MALNSQLHNPFESTFALLKALRVELNEVKQEVQSLREEKDARFDKVEANVDAMRSAKIERFEELEATVRELRMVKNARFEEMSQVLEELRAAKLIRFDKIESALKAEVNDRFATTQALDKKIRIEVAQLRAHCEKTTIEHSDLKVKTESTFTRDLQRHMDLRQDVEKLAAMLSDNSMSKDPFTGLGYRPTSPKSLGTSMDRNMLPSLNSTQTLKGLGSPLSQGSTGLQSPLKQLVA